MEDNPYQSPQAHAVKPTQGTRYGVAITACVLAVIGTAWPLPWFVELYQVPAGTAVRPMGAAGSVFLCGLGTPLLVMPLALLALSRGGASRWLGMLAALLSLFPLPVYWLLMRWIVSAHGLELKP